MTPRPPPQARGAVGALHGGRQRLRPAHVSPVTPRTGSTGTAPGGPLGQPRALGGTPGLGALGEPSPAHGTPGLRHQVILGGRPQTGSTLDWRGTPKLGAMGQPPGGHWDTPRLGGAPPNWEHWEGPGQGAPLDWGTRTSPRRGTPKLGALGPSPTPDWDGTKLGRCWMGAPGPPPLGHPRTGTPNWGIRPPNWGIPPRTGGVASIKLSSTLT